MKSKEKRRILAIDPGTRNLGYAVLESGSLRYCGVKTIPRRADSVDILKEGRMIISSLIKDFRPQVLVVERTYFGNNSGSVILNQLFRVIKSVGKRRGLQTISLPVNTVRKNVCGNGWANKEKVVKCLTKTFPQLKPYSISNREWKRDYNQNMFDAVALGLAAEELCDLHN
jgi:crossover junction endodeoxyribonuclease RuvC